MTPTTVAYFDTATNVLSVVTPTNRVEYSKRFARGRKVAPRDVVNVLARQGITVASTDADAYPYGFSFDVVTA